MVVRRGLSSHQVKIGVLVFVLQLLLNTAWSFIFFGAHNLFLALLEILVLWLTIVVMIYQFKKINGLAAYLLLPYLVWVTFAAFLNYTIWRLNT